MSVSADDVRAKVNGLLGALARLSAKERQQSPSAGFAKDYNKLRDLALQVMPDKPGVMPPALTVQPGARLGEMICREHYVEIFAYAQQIAGLLGNLAMHEDR